MVNNCNLLYSDEGNLDAVNTHEYISGATALYAFDNIVTSKGQSGGEIQLCNSQGKFQTIGVHNGNHQNLNLGTIITEQLFYGFIIPTLKQLLDNN